MKMKLALAIAALTMSGSALAATTTPATTWSGSGHAKREAQQAASGPVNAKHWANKQGAAPAFGREDIAAEIGANANHARKAMREGSMLSMQGLHIGGMPS